MSRVDPPEAVVELVRRLEAAGFETWCVGGAVRDALLGRPDLDWDLATAATPEQIQRVFRRTVPVGLKFGTVGVLDRSGRMHEVTTFRHDVETDGRHAVVRFGASLDEDLARRDLTINAMAYSPSRGLLHDPFGGRRDLELRVIRAVGEARARMREDRLRALRAIRLAARLDFDIEPTTWEAIVESAPHLGRLSPERVRQELEKTMDQVRRPAAAIRMWEQSGALRTLIPPLSPLTPLIDALDALPPPGLPGRPQRRLNRITALFLGLEPLDLRLVLGNLRFSNSQAAWIETLVRAWHALAPDLERGLMAADPPDRRLVRRWVALAGRTRAAPLFRLGYAVWCSRRALGGLAPDPARVRSAYRLILRTAYRDAIEIADLALTGEDLIAMGIPPSPALGKILRALLDIVLDDPRHNTRDYLLARALELRDTMNHPTGR